MLRCSNCGRESPVGASFCLNCGTKLQGVPAAASGAAGAAQGAAGRTLDGPGGLPGRLRCPDCGTENDPGMNFCQRCGRSIAETTPVPGGPGSPPPAREGEPAEASAPAGSGDVRSAAGRERQVCPNCGGHTPAGFSFCQQCGRALPSPRDAPLAVAPTPLGSVSGELGGSSGSMQASSAETGPTLAGGAEQTAGALPANAGRQPPHPTPAPPPPDRPPGEVAREVGGREAEARWGVIWSVRQDGSAGDAYPLAGDWIEIGRSAELSFDDPHLAPRHARFEFHGGRPRVVPLDRLNGIFYRVVEPVRLQHGDCVLLGRELLRFELVGEEEREARPLVRHGVALFASPPRPVWGRLEQLLPNGGVLDVRHLAGPEVMVGREEGDVVFTDDEFLSRRHAVFRWRNGACLLEDLRSSNGSFLRARTALDLTDGAELRIGDQMFRFEAAAR